MIIKDLSWIRTNLFGRTILTATPPSVLNAESVGAILNDIIPIHRNNADEIEYLTRYYRGNQPILSRRKEIRSEIMATIVENRAYEIIQSKLGYEFANDIQLINAGEKDSAPIETLNDYSRLDGKSAKDITLAENFYVCGTAYRICLPNLEDSEDNAPYFTDALNPCNTFVVYSNAVGHKKLLSGTYTKIKEKSGTPSEKEKWIYGVYTNSYYFTWEFDNQYGDFVQTKPTVKVNTLGMNPIVEYPLNESRLGYVELCIGLFNAINTTGSNRLDAVEQFVQALLVFINCELPVDPETKETIVPKSGDAINVKSNQGAAADVKYLVAQLDQVQTQTLKEDMLNAVYEICGVPDRKTRSTGGDTGQAVTLRDGWAAAEARARTTEKLFKRSEMEYLRIVLKICRDTAFSAAEIGGLTLRDIDVKFVRNRHDNLLVKSQAAMNLRGIGITLEDVLSAIELYGDGITVAKRAEAAIAEREAKAAEEARKAAEQKEAQSVSNSIIAAGEAVQNSNSGNEQ